MTECKHNDYHIERETVTTTVVNYIIRQKTHEDGSIQTQRQKSAIDNFDKRAKTKTKILRKWCTDCNEDLSDK